MPDIAPILESLQRGGRDFTTADRYFRDIERCFDGGFCPTKLFDGATPDQWRTALKDAEQKLVYSNRDMGVVEHKAVSEGGLLTFDAIVTTTLRDRDSDILETKGARLDERAPLLWQHVPMQPIGKLVRSLKHTDSQLVARFAIADTELGRDAATLVEMGALRISHGFNPEEYEPLEKEGWHFLKFEIFEVSLVSIPSNKDAVILAYSRDKLHSPLVKNWARKEFEDRKVQGIGATLKVSTELLDVSNDAQAMFPRMDVKIPKIGVLPNGSITSSFEVSDCEEGFNLSFSPTVIGALEKVFGESSACTCKSKDDGKAPGMGECPECGYEGPMSAFMGEKPEADEPDEKSVKAGRSLSAKNRKRISDAMTNMDEVCKMDDVSRPAKAMCREARGYLKEVMGAEEDEPKSYQDAERDLFALALEQDAGSLRKTIDRLKGLVQADEGQRQPDVIGDFIKSFL